MLPSSLSLKAINPEWQKLYPTIRGNIKQSKREEATLMNVIGTSNFYVGQSFPKSKEAFVGKYLAETEKLIEEAIAAYNIPFTFQQMNVRGKFPFKKYSLGRSSEDLVHKDNQNAAFDIKVAEKYLQLLRSAASRNLPFNLTMVDVRNLLTRKTCFYTGVKFGTGDLVRTIDRKNPNKGYVKGNVVACTSKSNSFKENLFEHKNVDLQHALKVLTTLISSL